MQRILNVLSIAAFAMSLTSWIVAIYKSSIRFNCDILDWRKVSGNIIQMYVHFENNSRFSISVNGASILSGDEKRPCELISKRIASYPEGNDLVFEKTACFPLFLLEYQAANVYMEFLHFEDISLKAGSTLDFEIYTNRQCLHRRLVAPEQAHCFRNRSQHRN